MRILFIIFSLQFFLVYGQENFALETPKVPFEDTVITHKAYLVSYNSAYRIPNWVGYLLTRVETVKMVNRSDNFKADPQIEETDNANDYKKSGYDRGHIAPSADMTFSKETMEESFYFSNICPQVPEFNRGVWKDLEEKVREWAVSYDSLYIISGPIVNDASRSIGAHHVVVPNQFFKIIYFAKNGREEMIAFVIPNEDVTSSFMRYAVPIDAVERMTGYDFFESLPDELEKKLEAKVNLRFWK